MVPSVISMSICLGLSEAKVSIKKVETLEAGLLNKSSCLALTLGVTNILKNHCHENSRSWLCNLSQTWIFNKLTLSQFVEQMLRLSSNFKCDQIHHRVR